MEETPLSPSCSDEYLEDGLPDLVLDATTYRSSTSSLLLDEKGLLDLLNDHHYSLSTSHLEEPTSFEACSSSASYLLLDYYNDDSIHKSQVYRSYLSLLPSENPSDSNFQHINGSLSKTASEESFLEKFKSLSTGSQESVRKKWREDLLLTQMDIGRIRGELEDKVEHALNLKKQLGMSFSWKEKMGYIRSLAKNAKSKFASSILENFD
ncbi:uncharacterized protein [Lepeophtheirus salmonis]|uniref:uncharacterized protein isoform X2 n=1 Tax=Lepeophtheirus salmonis TaxID=72036 RepID=UPI003AF3EAF6